MRLSFCLLLTALLCQAQPHKLHEQWSNDEHLKGASISYCVLDAATASVLAEHQSGLSLVPASTLKIFTTGAALGILGKDFRYTTTIACSGVLDKEGGILNGDLYIVGSGDPTLQSEYFGTGNIALKWAQELYDLGLREIRGTVTGYAGDWEKTVPDHWIWADISNYFGAVPCGLSFSDNKFSITFNSGQGGKAKVIDTKPRYKDKPYILHSDVLSEGSTDQAYVYGDPFSFEKNIRGSIPANRARFSIEAALPDPALLCAETLLQALSEKGIKCVGEAKSAYVKKELQLTSLLTHASPSLDQIVKQTNLHSNNHFCESLVLTLGKGNREAGLSAVRAYWRGKGFAVEGLFLSDGSGLSRASTCNTKLQALALQQMYNDSAMYNSISASLPAAGKQGSMRSMGRGTFIEDNLRAKTGYIQRVRAYCGYLKTRKGQDLVFSVIFNNYNCSPTQARQKIEAFMLSLAEL